MVRRDLVVIWLPRNNLPDSLAGKDQAPALSVTNFSGCNMATFERVLSFQGETRCWYSNAPKDHKNRATNEGLISWIPIWDVCAAALKTT